MALSLKDLYEYITGASAAYPWGSFKNASAPGAGDGTPFEKEWPNDIYGFLQALITKAGIVPSGAADTAETSQYLQAIQWLIAQSVPVATTFFGFYAAAPVGFLELNGGTVGNAISGASEFAGAGAIGIFSALWPHAALQTYDNTGAPVGRGANAAADFAANKRLAIPDMRGKTPRGWDHGAGVDPGRLMASYQADAQQNITGSFGIDDRATISAATGAFAYGDVVDTGSDGGGAGRVVTLDASRQVRTAAEVRVKSIAGMFVIKF